MRVLQQVNRRAGFQKQQHLRGSINRREIRDRLGTAAIQKLKILLLESFHKVAFGIGNDHPDVHAFDIDANAVGLSLRMLLRGGGNGIKRKPEKRGTAEAERFGLDAAPNFSPATRQSELPWHPSMMHRSCCAGGVGKLRG